MSKAATAHRRMLLPAAAFTMVLFALTACMPIQAGATQAQAKSESGLPLVTEYDLGEDVLVESHMPEESRFRTMPVRLNGVIGVPEGDGPAPVVLILHGTHPGCPETSHMVDEWPCAPEVEQRNYAGWAWLAQRLAEAGYVAIAPNVNAENTFGWGEPPAGQRLLQLVDKHLGALALASAGEAGAPRFGVDVTGRADLANLLLIGHSRGAGEAMRLLRERNLEAESPPEGQPFGPARGILAVTPAITWLDEARLAVPLVVLLSACDGDITDGSGQLYYENLRRAVGQETWASSLWLERANHNSFNTNLDPDVLGPFNRTPACERLLSADEQRQFLGNVAVDLATAVFSADRTAAIAARERLGVDPDVLVPVERYGVPARTISLAPATDRLVLLVPNSESTLANNAQGGRVFADNVKLTYCPPGFGAPFLAPGTEPCRRPNFIVPGQPAMIVVAWSEPGGALRLELPEGADLSDFSAVSLRVAVDPLSELNAEGATQAFSLRLTDGAGHSAVAQAPADNPALSPPSGSRVDDATFPPGLFTGLVPLTTVRVPPGAFAGVDLADVHEVALVFDQTESGTLFVADLEVVRSAADSE